MATSITNLKPEIVDYFEQINSKFYTEYMAGCRKGMNGRWSKSDTLKELMDNY
jgi:hypothetical protein